MTMITIIIIMIKMIRRVSQLLSLPASAVAASSLFTRCSSTKILFVFINLITKIIHLIIIIMIISFKIITLMMQECLQRWIKSSDIKRCELCKFPFVMQSKVEIIIIIVIVIVIVIIINIIIIIILIIMTRIRRGVVVKVNINNSW